jgi:hypothetical protein
MDVEREASDVDAVWSRILRGPSCGCRMEQSIERSLIWMLNGAEY